MPALPLACRGKATLRTVRLEGCAMRLLHESGMGCAVCHIRNIETLASRYFKSARYLESPMLTTTYPSWDKLVFIGYGVTSLVISTLGAACLK